MSIQILSPSCIYQRGEPNTLGTLCYAPNHGVWWNTAHGSGQPDIGLQASPLRWLEKFNISVEPNTNLTTDCIRGSTTFSGRFVDRMIQQVITETNEFESTGKPWKLKLQQMWSLATRWLPTTTPRPTRDGMRKRGETATPLAQQPKTTEMLMSATGSPTPESTDK